MTGHADYQNIVQWVGAPALRSQTVTLDGSGSFSAIAQVVSTNYRGALVRVAPQVNPVNVTVSHVVDDVGGLIGSGVPIFVPAGTVLVFAMDLWAQEVTVNLNGAAGAQVGIGVWPTNLPPGCYNPPPGSKLLTQWPSGVIPAGNALAFDLAPYFGPATIVGVGPGVAGVRIIWEVEQLDTTSTFLGNTFRRDDITPALPQTDVWSAPIWLPPGRNQVNLTNVGPGNIQMYVSVVGKYNVAPFG